MITLRHPVALIITFVWVGFVCAISFLEAWLKFRAEGVTLPIGLGIGRLVFGALNKVELVLAVSIAIELLITKGLGKRHWIVVLPFATLLLQTFFVLPALDERAALVIAGADPQPSNLHLVFVAMELVKVAALVVFGAMLLRPVVRDGTGGSVVRAIGAEA